MTSELETNIVAVERVKEYSETPTEAEWIYPDNRPPADWPHKGRMRIEGFDLKYREGLPLVLKNIDCAIEPGEKVLHVKIFLSSMNSRGSYLFPTPFESAPFLHALPNVPHPFINS